MEYLMREDAPFSQEQWDNIDETVIRVARQVLVGRKFLNIYGPLGSGAQSINIDDMEADSNGDLDFFGDEDTGTVKSRGRRFVEIPIVYKDLVISWRDVENSRQFGLPLDISPVAGAAALCAKKEDDLIFNGNSELGYGGLLNVNGAARITKSDWSMGENPFTDVSKGIEILVNKGFVTDYALIMSTDLYIQLQRLQPNAGVLEIDRVKELVNGRVFQTPVLGSNKAVLVCSQPQNMDLVIGQDMITAYMGEEKMNYSLRVFETILPRIKRKEAIVIFE